MKKSFAIFMIFIIAFVGIGCNDKGDNGKDKDQDVRITGIEISGHKSEIEITEELQLTATVKPAGVNQEVIWTSKNTLAITVDATGKITPVGYGTAEIVATSKVNSRIFQSVNITVKEEVVILDPDSVEITGSTQVTVNSNISLTATVLPEGASQEVLWETSDETIAIVNTNGRVTGKGVGEVTITVKVAANQEITDTHVVTVLDDTIIVEPVDPTDIVIQGEDTMNDGYSITLIATVLPVGVNQNIIWSSSNNTIATVNSNGLVTSLREGTVYIFATSAIDASVMKTHKIVVRPAPIIEPYPDMQGYEIKIMAAGHVLGSHDPFHPEYVGTDVTARQKAWRDVEARFNCKILVVGYPDSAPWGPTRVSYMLERAQLNTAEADIYVATTEWIKQLVDGNAIINTKDFYDSFGQNSLMPAFRASGTYKSGLYVLPTSSSAGGINVENGIFYNMALVERLGLESPAKLFNEGKWTYTDFYNYVAAANSVLPPEHFVLSGEPSLYWHGMVNAGGVRIMDTTTLSINLGHAYSRQAVQTLRKAVDIGAWDVAGSDWDNKVVSFNEGRSIFQPGEYWFVRTDNRWSAYLWDEGGNSRFGYVPFPYPDNLQKEFTRTTFAGGGCYMLANGRVYSAGVTARDVYRAFTEMMLDTVTNMKDDPNWSLESEMTIIAQRRLDDPESVIAMVFFKNDKVIFDPVRALQGFFNAESLGPRIRSSVFTGTDFDEAMAGANMSLSQRLLEVFG